MAVYEWAEGRSKSVPAQIVGEELERIEVVHGAVTPEALVTEAKKKTSPLHSLIEWSDNHAAYLYRLWQARSVINSIDVVVNEADPVRVQAFVSVNPGTGGRRYVAHTDAVTDDALYALVVAELKGLVNSYRRKLAGYERFRDLIQAIEDAA